MVGVFFKSQEALSQKFFVPLDEICGEKYSKSGMGTNQRCVMFWLPERAVRIKIFAKNGVD